MADAIAHAAAGTLTAGVHDQSRQDVNGDGWADLAGYRRYSVRPRIWWNEGQDQSLYLTAGITEERREGGMDDTDAQTLAFNDGSGLSTLNVTATNGLTTNGTTTIDIGINNLSAGTKVLVDYSGSILGSGFGFVC